MTSIYLLILVVGAVAQSDHDHDHGAHGHGAPEDGVVVAQLLFLVGIMAVTLLPVFIPMQRFLNEDKLALVRCFSGGIFFSIGFFHLLADATLEFRSVDLGNFQDGFALILAMIGYLLIFFIEKVACNTEEIARVTNTFPVITPVMEEAPIKSPNVVAGSQRTSYVILVALSIHALFEGLALGVQKEISGVISLAVGILAHKWAESLSLSVAMLDQVQTKKHKWIVWSIFTLVSPIGIVIGILISEWSSAVLTATALALSGGTFVYIACSERFIKEFQTPHRKYQKFLAIILGIGMIILLASFHSHDH